MDRVYDKAPLLFQHLVTEAKRTAIATAGHRTTTPHGIPARPLRCHFYGLEEDGTDGAGVPSPDDVHPEAVRTLLCCEAASFVGFASFAREALMLRRAW
ncbi:hypothetical protein ColTof4_00226 [Colletotrichum tofieldiae]|nr:hypothetical protein ColTof3_07428 [Colletotrichum tofieldiae]GKT67803.1 hypothetical protein ColTof4_00226 [Colletotrichum tofieldiae]GKT91233.1 hypothetical protein Ct61P_09083 [Colletotrichum tofieldiae]